MGWLVLSRKKEERIKIGPDITVVITDIRGSIVSVGIKAPNDLRIERLAPVSQTNDGTTEPPTEGKQ